MVFLFVCWVLSLLRVKKHGRYDDVVVESPPIGKV